MKVVNYEFPKSSFLSIEKDLEIITNKLFKNTRLQRLLYYTTPDALDRPSLTDDQVFSLFEKNIKIIPKITVQEDVASQIVISFDNFTPNLENPEFRNNIITFDIICHFDQWRLKNSFQLRPYRLAAEIDTMFNNVHLTGIGTLEFLGAKEMVINEEYAGVSLMYLAIHGEEDRKGQLNPADNANFEKEFNQIFNS